MGGVPNPDYHLDLMKIANNFANKRRYSEAVKSYDRVLSLNPNHTDAMQNKAMCLAYDSDVHAAIEIMVRGIKLERNLTKLYHCTATWMTEVGHPEVALHLLNSSLSRYGADFKTWKRLTEVAIKYDLIKMVTDRISEGIQRCSNIPPSVTQLQSQIKESEKRTESYNKLFSAGIEAQKEGAWRKAFELFSRATKISKNNALAKINYYACNYRLGEYGLASDGIWETMHLLISPMRVMPTALLGLLSSVKIEQWDRSKSFALILARIDNPVDLPSIPVTIVDQFTIESRGVDEILVAVERLRDARRWEDSVATAINDLLDGYRKLGEALRG